MGFQEWFMIIFYVHSIVESQTPISIALKEYLNENPSGIVIKFVNLFIGAIQKIISP